MARDGTTVDALGRAASPDRVRKGRPPASSSAETRRRILDAARACFGRAGYDRTINKDIAAAAGITQAAIYHYFPSKRDVFVATYRDMQATTFAGFEAAIDPKRPLAANIKAMLDLAADMHAADRTLAAFTAIAPLEIQRHPEVRRGIGDDAQTVFGFFRRLVAESSDGLRSDVDPESVVNLLVAVTTGFSQFGATARGGPLHRGVIGSFERLLDGTLFNGAGSAATPKRRRLVARPPAVDPTDSRARILAAARARFGGYGYDVTTNKDIGAAAGFTAGAIYRYFSSKQELFVTVYREVQRAVFDRFEVALEGTNHLADKIKAFLDLSVDMHAADRTLATFTAIAPVEIQRHPELRAALGADTVAVYRFFRQVVWDAADDLAPDVDPDAVVNLLVAVSSGFAQFGAMTRTTAPHREAIASFQRLIDGTLFTGSAGGRARRRRAATA